jgi:tetratricopeptide (TPR) repeat protein
MKTPRLSSSPAFLAVLLVGSPALLAADVDWLNERVAALQGRPVTETVNGELRELLALAASVEAEGPDTVQLLSELGRRAKVPYPAEAATLLARSVEACGTGGAADWERAQQDAISLASIALGLKDLAAEEQWLRRAIEIGRLHLGGPQRHALDRLARLLERVRPGTDEAVELLRESVAGQPERVVHSTMGSFFRTRGDHERALEHLHALLLLDEQEGVSPRDLTETLARVAEAEAAAGRPELAEPLFLRALSAVEGRLGGRHPALIETLERVGAFYAGQERWGEAEQVLSRAFEIAQRARGECPACSAKLLEVLTRVYEAQRRPIDFCTQEDAEVQAAPPAPPVPDAIATIDEEVAGLLGRREHALARERALEGLALREATYGHFAIELLPSLRQLWRVENNLGPRAAEQAVLERELEILEALAPSDRERIVEILYRLSHLVPPGDLEREYLEREVEVREELGQVLRAAHLLERLARDAEDRKDWRAVVEYVSRAVGAWESMAGPESPEYVALRNRLVQAYRALGMEADPDAGLWQWIPRGDAAGSTDP